MKRSLFHRASASVPGSRGNLYGNQQTDDITAANEKYFGDADDSIHHSRYYHRFFEGYTEVRTPDPTSRVKPYKIERIYTAPYTVVDMERYMYFVYRLVYSLLLLLALVLYVSAFTDDRVAFNTNPRAAASAVMVTAVPLFVFAVSLIAYWLRPKRMKYYDYRTSTKRLKLWPLISAGGCVLAALLCGVFLLVKGSADAAAELLFIVRLIAAALACTAVFLLERRMPYKQIENDVILPEGEYHRIQ